MTFTTREEWLEAALGQLLRVLPKGTIIPPVKVSVGWPKGASDRKTAGQCFSKKMSHDEATHHVFISPMLTDPVDVLRTGLHEVIHALVGVEVQHRGEFARLAGSVGLLKPWTSTPASDELRLKLQDIAAGLGEYPHVGLAPGMKKQTTRMKLYECLCSPPQKVRKAGRRLNATCDDCGGKFIRQEE